MGGNLTRARLSSSLHRRLKRRLNRAPLRAAPDEKPRLRVYQIDGPRFAANGATRKSPPRSDADRAACPIVGVSQPRSTKRAMRAAPRGRRDDGAAPVQSRSTPRDAGCGRLEPDDVYAALLEPAMTGACDRIAFRSLIGRDQIAASLTSSAATATPNRPASGRSRIRLRRMAPGLCSQWRVKLADWRLMVSEPLRSPPPHEATPADSSRADPDRAANICLRIASRGDCSPIVSSPLRHRQARRPVGRVRRTERTALRRAPDPPIKAAEEQCSHPSPASTRECASNCSGRYMPC